MSQQFFMNEGVFDLPELPFVDKTVHLLKAPIAPGKELGLVVCRAVVKAERTLDEVVSAHLEHEARSLRGFTIVGKSAGECAGYEAVAVASKYRLTDEMAYQRQVHALIGGVWMMFGVTGPLADRAACDELLTGVVASFQLRTG